MTIGDKDRQFKILLKDTPEVKFTQEDKTSSPANVEKTVSVTGSALPIKGWRMEEAVDVLIVCTVDYFKIHINGKPIQTWTSLHNLAPGKYPKISKIINSKRQSKMTMLSWTYGKT